MKSLQQRHRYATDASYRERMKENARRRYELIKTALLTLNPPPSSAEAPASTAPSDPRGSSGSPTS